MIFLVYLALVSASDYGSGKGMNYKKSLHISMTLEENVTSGQVT
jgi:hypothetical protein